MHGHPCITLPAILVYPADFPLFEYSCLTFCLVLKGFLQILWWFRFTSLLLKINICAVIICTAVLRILIMLHGHGKECKSLFLKLPVQSLLSQRFLESLYLHCKRRLKWSKTCWICLGRMILKPLRNWEQYVFSAEAVQSESKDQLVTFGLWKPIIQI